MSLLFLDTRQDLTLRFGVWRLSESEAELAVLCGLSAPAHLKVPARRLEYLGVRVLAVHMGLDPSRIAYRPTGQPYLVGDDRCISITHTKGYAGLLLSEQAGVGIDMEARSHRVFKIRQRFMHPEEVATLEADAPDEATGLLLHWCVKEAVFKAIPDEGVDFARDIRVDLGRKLAVHVPSGTVFLLEWQANPDYVLAVCHQ